MLKSFLHGNAFIHFRVGSHYKIFNAFFNVVKFQCNLDFMAELCCQNNHHVRLQSLMLVIDKAQDQRQKIIFFLGGVLRFFLQSHYVDDFSGIVAFINCAVGITAGMPEVNKGINAKIVSSNLMRELYNLLMQDAALADRAIFLFQQGFGYQPPQIPQHVTWQMYTDQKGGPFTAPDGAMYFPSTLSQ